MGSYTTEGRSQLLPPRVTAGPLWDLLLQLSSARVSSGPVLGQEKPLDARSLWSGANPVTRVPALPWSCSWAQQSTAVSGRRRAADRWNQTTSLQDMSKHQHQATAASRGLQHLRLLSPPINGHPRLHGNKPRLGTCLKGELSIAKLNHIRKC